MSNKIELKLKEPHAAQMKVIEESRRFNVVCCGRRWGKTQLGMDRLIETSLGGQPVAWFSPSYRIMGEVWRELQSVLGQVIRQKNEQEKRLELIGGGVIELWSLDSPDAGRSRKYALVVVDEASLIPSLAQAWQESIRPTLADFKGKAWFLSTPQGMNYFKELFDRGQDSQEKDWASWQMPTQSNPFIDPAEIEASRRDLTESRFNQEYLAQFVDSEGSVFRRVMQAATAVPTQPEDGREYIIGCDWGRTQDYTVFVVLDAQSQAMVALDRSNRVDYAVQRARLQKLVDLWQPKQILAETNSIGQPILEQLEREGLRVQPFTTTNTSKKLAIEALVLAFERGDIRILNDSVLISELLAYRAEQLPSGLLRYGAPSGQHDDCVMALAIAWSAISAQQQVVYAIPEPEFTVAPFAIPDHWQRAYGMDVGWSATAVIWGALDPNTGRLYLYDEYYSQGPNLRIDVEAIRDRRSWICGALDPEGNGRQREDGLRMLQLYNGAGLQLAAASGNLESGIMDVHERLSRGRLKVFTSLARCREQLRGYRRDDRGHVTAAGGSLVEAVRCLVVSGLLRMRTAPVKTPRKAPWLDEFMNGKPRDAQAWMR
jgi:hypothetical protein